MKSSLQFFILALLMLGAATALADYPVATASLTFNDPDRGGRPVPCDLYYPDGMPAPAGFPVLAVGHGFLMSTEVYSWLGERLAGAGYVVAVPRTGGELFPDHGEFAADLAFATRAVVEAGNDEASPLFGLTADRRGVLGHSMGGGASLLAAAGDPGLRAVANLAAAETNPSAIAASAQLDCAVLLVAGTNDCVTPPADHQLPMYQALDTTWRTLAVLDGASHCQFAANSFTCNLGEFCSADITRELQWERTWYLLEPWLAASLRADAQALARFSERLSEASAWATIQTEGSASTVLPPAPDLDLTAFPNPFNPVTSLRFQLGTSAHTTLAIFDAAGRKVATPLARHLEAGAHQIEWRGVDESGRSLASGLYLVRLVTRAGTSTTKLLLLE